MPAKVKKTRIKRKRKDGNTIPSFQLDTWKEREARMIERGLNHDYMLRSVSAVFYELNEEFRDAGVDLFHTAQQLSNHEHLENKNPIPGLQKQFEFLQNLRKELQRFRMAENEWRKKMGLRGNW